MSRKLAAPRGTRDLLPQELTMWERVEETARDLSRRYAFERIETPLFESVDVFVRGVGEATELVEKQLFLVSGPAEADDAAARWALRPEPTAGIVRAYVENGMVSRPHPLRLWTMGPMFRYDRPQAGRYRQFVQWDVEVIGDAGPMVDAELIELGHRFYADVGVEGVVANLNSLGDEACRPAYRAAVTEYFERHADRLSDDSRRRLATNPLRILDDKTLDPGLAADAPRSLDHLCDACRAHFEAVRALLEELGLRYRLEHRLVRGLDYYARTTFEFFREGREGQQDALGGGGRYDGLVELLGGQPTPGIGFGLGIDRSVLALDEEALPEGRLPAVAVVSGAPGLHADRLRAADVLRRDGWSVWVDGSDRKLGRQLESAARRGAHWAVIVGADAPAGVVVRDLETGEQREVQLEQLPTELAGVGSVG
ncbi:MAG: histidine--tRNA ligase [Chloroflexota bacterium]|nr:histidine--tRNA ligase [Chloroflexota bacterium]